MSTVQSRLLRPLCSVTFAIALAWSAVPIALLAYHTIRFGGVLSGSDGPLAGGDQLFYMDEIRQSGQHLLIADHSDLTIGHAVFLHPLYLFAGVLWRLGLPLQAAFWALQIIGAVVLAAGSAALAYRVLRSPIERAAGVALALFYFSPVLPLLAWIGSIGAGTRYQLLVPAAESMPAWQLWGYPHSPVAVGALTMALLGAARLPETLRQRDARRIALVSVAAFFAAWLHPWQGATFIVVSAALAVHARSWQLARRLLVPAAAVAAPLIYEAILSRTDAGWRLDSTAVSVGHEAVWMVAVALLPLIIPALLGIRRVPAGPLRVVLVVWPLACLAVYFASSEFPYHALQGISFPLAMLAMLGCRGLLARAGRLRLAPAGLAAVALLTVPGAVYELKTFRDAERSGLSPYWFTPGERAALAYLDRAKTPGGVLARQYLGTAVGAFTGRRTWVGEWSWTPDYAYRAAVTEKMMAGQMPPAEARRLVSSIGARYALTDCRAPQRLDRLLGSLVIRRYQFGCAAVYELATPRPALAARVRAARERPPL